MYPRQSAGSGEEVEAPFTSSPSVARLARGTGTDVEVPSREATTFLTQGEGPKARYIGTRRNLFDLRRLSSVQNLEAIARHLRNQAVTA